MHLVFAAQSAVVFGLWVFLLGLKAFAFVDALRYSEAVYQAVGKQSKAFWLVVLGLSALVQFVTDPLGFLGIVGTVVSLIYLFAIRPELQRYKGVGRGRSSSGGPYGGW